MGPHTSCAVECTGPGADGEVRMVLSQSDPKSRPGGEKEQSSLKKKEEEQVSRSTRITEVDAGGHGATGVSWLPSSSDSDTEQEAYLDLVKENEQVWEISAIRRRKRIVPCYPKYNKQLTSC